MFESESLIVERREFETQLRNARDASYEAVADCSQAVLDWGNQVIAGLGPDELMPPLPPALKAEIENVTKQMAALGTMTEQGRV